MVNEPVRRGRVTGTDLLPASPRPRPLQVFGMGGAELPAATGLPPTRLRSAATCRPPRCTASVARCRVYLHPLRWTSLGLALLEAMHLGHAGGGVGHDGGRPGRPAGGRGHLHECRRTGQRRAVPAPATRRRPGNAAHQAREAALSRYGLARFLNDWDCC